MIALKKDNFFKTTLAAGISDSAASMTLQTGDAARLSSDGPYRLVLWGAAYTNPGDDANAEIVEATKDSGEDFDIVRAREGTTARAWSAEDNVALTPTAGTFDEVSHVLKEFALANLAERTQSIFTSGINAIAYGGGVWVAVGNGGKIATSDDGGFTWTERTSNFGTEYVSDVAYDGSGRWVAVGGATTGMLATSDDDGVTWTQRNSSFGSNKIKAVAHDGSGLWVAVSHHMDGYLATSPDGITWTQRTPLGSSLEAVAHDGTGMWVVAGKNGTLATSPDGINWTSRTSQFGSNTIEAVTYNGSLWAAVGASGAISTSPDGTTWTARTLGISATLMCVASGHGGILAAAGYEGRVVVSHDGTEWVELAAETSGENIFDMDWDGHRWVLVSISGTILGSLRLP